ncbi:MAG: ATP-grasp domain-containing protein, partial [Candidatus Bathyarchaeota archaeon]|nr:ATP-grasp domain-containing protein [Candidatus Bathyarchaeota archaeon]
VVSVNEQLIGIKRLGANTPFGYCGNIVPLKANEKTVNRIKDVSYALGKKLNLIGSNGFDFVIGKNDELYLMEVNPRFQATLECIQYVTGLNLVSEHIKACHCELPEKIPKPKGYAAKMIVFAKHLSKIPDLSKLKNVFDITPPSIIVDRGEPICTVQMHESTKEKAIRRAWKQVKMIYRLIDALR